jgi:N-acetylneuraminic acid mutarotase
MINPRRDFVFASADGMLYAMGGDQGPGCSGTALAEAYNPSTNVWTELAPLPTDQHGAAGGAIHGRIYVAGGFDCSLGRSVVTTRAYDPRTDSWSLRASMPPGLGYKSTVLDGKLYVASTPTSAVFDPEADSWHLAASLPEPVGAGGAAAVHGVLYVVGQVGSAPPYSDVMFAYSPGWPLGLF